MQTLDEIRSLLPKNKQHLIAKAYELGRRDLDSALAAKPTPAGTSPAALPALPKSLLFQALLSKVIQMQIPCHRLELKKEEKQRMGMIEAQNDNALAYLLQLLPKHLKVSHSQDALTQKQATDEYVDNFSTLLWEAMDAVLSSDDPVKAVSLLRLMQEEGTSSVVLTPDEEPQLQAA